MPVSALKIFILLSLLGLFSSAQEVIKKLRAENPEQVAKICTRLQNIAEEELSVELQSDVSAPQRNKIESIKKNFENSLAQFHGKCPDKPNVRFLKKSIETTMTSCQNNCGRLKLGEPHLTNCQHVCSEKFKRLQSFMTGYLYGAHDVTTSCQKSDVIAKPRATVPARR